MLIQKLFLVTRVVRVLNASENTKKSLSNHPARLRGGRGMVEVGGALEVDCQNISTTILSLVKILALIERSLQVKSSTKFFLSSDHPRGRNNLVTTDTHFDDFFEIFRKFSKFFEIFRNFLILVLKVFSQIVRIFLFVFCIYR